MVDVEKVCVHPLQALAASLSVVKVPDRAPDQDAGAWRVWFDEMVFCNYYGYASRVVFSEGKLFCVIEDGASKYELWHLCQEAYKAWLAKKVLE